jgi:hypothetical protein
MKISVRGKTDGLTKNSTRYICKQASELLLSPKLSNNIYVQIQYMKLEDDSWGYCSPTDFECRLHREFEILINSQISKINQVKTLVHEMVHLKQFAKGEFKQYQNESYSWLGKRMQISSEDYYNMPWEIEAVEMERTLCQEIAKKMKVDKISL